MGDLTGLVTPLGASNVVNQLQTGAEAQAGITPKNFNYGEGDLRRYGAVGDGATNNYTAIVNALAVASKANAGGNNYQSSGSVYIPGGIFRYQCPGLAAGTAAASASQSISTGLFTTATQAFVAGTMVTVSGTIPTGFSAGVIYYVIAAGLTTTACALSLSSGGAAVVPSVSAACTLTVQTGIVVPSYVTIYGLTRQYNVATLQPYQCGGLILDGNGLFGVGSFVEDIWLKSFMIDCQYVTATNAFYMNNVYTFMMRDVEINGGYTNLPTCTNMVGIYGSSADINCIFDDVSVYGNSRIIGTNAVGVNIQKLGGTLKFNNLDAEYVATGVVNKSANSFIDFLSPYSESCSVTSYYHGATGTGQTNFFGGSLQGGTGCLYGMNIQGDNLAVYGTTVPAGSVASAAFNIAATPAFKNVQLYGQGPEYGNTLIQSGANIGSVNVFPPYLSGLCRGVFSLTKSLVSGAATSLFTAAPGNLIKFKVTLYATTSGSGGAGSASATYNFCLPGSGIVPTIGSDIIPIASASQTVATPGVFSTVSQSLAATQPVYITGTAPAGFTANSVVYYIASAGLTSTACELSTTYNGTGAQCTGSSPCLIVPAGSSQAFNGNWINGLLNPTLSYAASKYTFSITATSAGALGGSSNVIVYGEVEWQSYDIGATNSIVLT